MTGILIRKILRDLRLPLLVVMLLLMSFQCLWAKITAEISGNLLPGLAELASKASETPESIENEIFSSGPGKFLKAMIGGDRISIFRTKDMLAVGYVHAIVIITLCIWAIGRASSAIVGEVDRGTMELLLAQPVARYQVVLSHFVVDLATIPLICLSLWAGNWLGVWVAQPMEAPAPVVEAPQHKIKVMGFELALPTSKPTEKPPEPKPIDVTMFAPALVNVGSLVFAMTGYTLWLSAAGRFRGRVLGAAVLITLLQFLINVVGQLWSTLTPLRKLTVFYYYQPQPIMLNGNWMVDLGPLLYDGSWSLGKVNVVVVLFCVGMIGYGMALWTFTRRDLPAPL